MAQIFLFGELYKINPITIESLDDYYDYLSEYLIYLGFKDLLRHKKSNQRIFGNTEFELIEGKKVNLFEYSDFHLPKKLIRKTFKENYMTKERQRQAEEVIQNRLFSLQTESIR